MSYDRNCRSFLPGVCLFLGVWCAGTTVAGTASTAPSRPAPSEANAPQPTAVADPCAPPAATMQTKAAAKPSRRSTSALADLVMRAKNQAASPTDPNHSRSLPLELWSSRITAPSTGDDTQASLALQQLIRQVHSLTTTSKNAVQPPVTAVVPGPAALPTAAVVPMESTKPAPAPTPTTTVAATAPALSPEAQKTLASLQKNPSQLGDPLETAELLFLSGRPVDATPFYQEALRRTHAGEAATADDRAWILFQLGNCLRETDTAQAQTAYAKLIAEFPNCPWTEMARAGSRLLTWYQSTRPDQLMKAPGRH